MSSDKVSLFVNPSHISHADQFLTAIQLLQPLRLSFIDQQINVHLQKLFNEKTVPFASDEVVLHIRVLHNCLLHFVVSDQKVDFLLHATELVVVEAETGTAAISLQIVKSVADVDVSVRSDISKQRTQRLHKSDSVVNEDASMFLHQEVSDQSSGYVVSLVDQLIVHFCWFLLFESVFKQFNDFGDLERVFLRKVFGVILV